MHKLAEYLTKNEKEHIIFDLDETILRLELPWDMFITKAWEIFDRMDHKLVLANPHTVTRTNIMMNMIIEKHGEEAKTEMYDYLEFFENHYLKGITRNEALIEWILANKNKYTYYLWTSQMQKSVQNVLQMANLQGLFKGIASRDMVRLTKPYPDGFKLLTKDEEPDRTKYLMVGDSEFDEGAARNADIDFFFEDYFKK